MVVILDTRPTPTPTPSTMLVSQSQSPGQENKKRAKRPVSSQEENSAGNGCKKRRNASRNKGLGYKVFDNGEVVLTKDSARFLRIIKDAGFKQDTIPRKDNATTKDFMENGFYDPFIIKAKYMKNIGMKVPSNITPDELCELIGPDFPVPVMSVNQQRQRSMFMKDWVKHFKTPSHQRDPANVLNVISLEISKTKLAELIRRPKVVEEIDWTSKLWPDFASIKRDPEARFSRVQYYCLMGTEMSYTDFHVDFGGSSVWYHVVRGEKWFYLIEPTPQHLAMYRDWSNSLNQNATYFAALVGLKNCTFVKIKAGETLFIPTGWIHAVYTPVDTLVFGGNFIHSLGMVRQLQVHQVENMSDVDQRFRYPWYDALHWMAAFHYTQVLSKCRQRLYPMCSYQVTPYTVFRLEKLYWLYEQKIKWKNLFPLTEYQQSLIPNSKMMDQKTETNKLFLLWQQKMRQKWKKIWFEDDSEDDDNGNNYLETNMPLLLKQTLLNQRCKAGISHSFTNTEAFFKDANDGAASDGLEAELSSVVLEGLPMLLQYLKSIDLKDTIPPGWTAHQTSQPIRVNTPVQVFLHGTYWEATVVKQNRMKVSESTKRKHGYNFTYNVKYHIDNSIEKEVPPYHLFVEHYQQADIDKYHQVIDGRPMHSDRNIKLGKQRRPVTGAVMMLREFEELLMCFDTEDLPEKHLLVQWQTKQQMLMLTGTGKTGKRRRKQRIAKDMDIERSVYWPPRKSVDCKEGSWLMPPVSDAASNSDESDASSVED